jgi:hypothetical protein
VPARSWEDALAESLAALRAEVRALGGDVRALCAEEARRADEYESRLAAVRDDLVAIGQLALDDEAATRRLLGAARGIPEYELPFTEPDPLVSVCIPTYTNYRSLVERAIPSVLAQDHRHIEVVVVGDAAPSETAAAIKELGDSRVRYENLPTRGPYPQDALHRWMVAGTGPLNRSIDLARGSWIVVFNDDDALRPDHVRKLVATARAARAEIAYGKFERHRPDGPSDMVGIFPPQHRHFNWQSAVQHRAIARLFQYELAAALFNEPGDWHRARRMLRSGVRFSMIDDVVYDYYPSRLWSGR